MTESSNPPSPLKELSGRIGKYEIVRPLGKGAMGIVYLAHDTDLERDVALKVMVAHIADDPELKARFEREAKTVARMTHPNVVAIFDRGYHTDGSPYIAMELLKGQDLQHAVRDGTVMSLDRKVGIIVQVLAGLAHAHEAGIVHRDIKPANIFINADGTVKIMDFGVARLTTASMTGTGNIVGTADYMSPEQVKGAKVDGRSDLFSVGCMLFELIVGQKPFHSDNLMAIFYKITHEEANLSLLPSSTECQALRPILQKALARNLEDRYQTAYEFAVALRQYLEAHASSRSGEHALEQFRDLRPPGSGTQAGSRTGTMGAGATIVEAQGDELAGATVDIPATRRGSAAPPGSTMRPGPAPASAGRSSLPRKPPPASHRPLGTSRPAPARRSSGTGAFAYVGVAAAIVAAAGAYLYLKPKPALPPPRPVGALVTAAPVATATMTDVPVTPTVAPTPPTAAPVATLGEVHGSTAGLVKAAHAAIQKGDYARALEQAQSALRAEPDNAQAQQIVDSAVKGQKAQGHFRQAEEALRQSQWADAQREADTGRAIAPWDPRGPDLLTRIQEAQRQADQQKQAQNAALIAGYLSKAASELAADRYDAAIALYDEVLKLDPQNPTAINSKTNAVVAKKMAESAAGKPAVPEKAFVNGTTAAQSPETRGGAVPDGFDDTTGLGVKKASKASELPGRITFEIQPAGVKAGEKFTVRILFANEGAASIPISDLVVTTVADGRKMSGAVPVSVKEVAPHQKEVLLSQTDFWKDVSSWSMEATVRTARGETYKNQVTWR